jgi:putative DNA primase/helicase
MSALPQVPQRLHPRVIAELAERNWKRDRHVIVRQVAKALARVGISLEIAEKLLYSAVDALNDNTWFIEGDGLDYPLGHQQVTAALRRSYSSWRHSKSPKERDNSDVPSVAVLSSPIEPQQPTIQPSEPATSGSSEADQVAVPASKVIRKRIRLRADVLDLRNITRFTWEIIEALNQPPTLFRHGSLVSRIEGDDSGSPVVREMTNDRMRGFLADIIEWRKLDKKADELVSALPPMHVVKNILATPNVRLPVLERIIQAPVFAPDGELQTEPGYNAATRCLYYPRPGFVLPPVAESPTVDDVKRARELIFETFIDFPFVGEAERAHAIAALMLPFTRAIINGPTPLHLIEKPSPGTGATLLTDVIGMVVAGESPAQMTEGRDDDEWRKRVTAKLRQGPSMILIDNLRRKLDSGALSAALTADWWEDRLLGQSEMVKLPVRCLWLASGNNPVLSHEIARRTVRIRMEAPGDMPWLGRKFLHPNLLDWVNQRRGDLVWAVLTLVRAWLAQGRTRGKQTLGMYEKWATVMGGILEVAEIPGFLTNLEDLYESCDLELSSWGAFADAWWNQWKGEVVGVGSLLPIAMSALLDVGDGGDHSQRIKLGNQLMRMKDRQFGRFRFVNAGTLYGAQQWKLVPVEDQT